MQHALATKLAPAMTRSAVPSTADSFSGVHLAPSHHTEWRGIMVTGVGFWYVTDEHGTRDLVLVVKSTKAAIVGAAATTNQQVNRSRILPPSRRLRSIRFCMPKKERQESVCGPNKLSNDKHRQDAARVVGATEYVWPPPQRLHFPFVSIREDIDSCETHGSKFSRTKRDLPHYFSTRFFVTTTRKQPVVSVNIVHPVSCNLISAKVMKSRHILEIIVALVASTCASALVPPRDTSWFDATTTTAAVNRIVPWAQTKSQNPNSKRSLALKTARDDKTRGGAARNAHRRPLDVSALAKYVLGVGVQLSTIYAFLVGIDKILAKLAWKMPLYAKMIFFYLFNTQTGKFSPLSQKTQPKDKNFQKPSWTPPGWVFALMWPLFVFGIRAFAAARIVQACGEVFANPAIMVLMFHLSFGNLWSTVNRVEKRLGASVPCLYGLLFSNVYASYRFGLLDPLSGKLLLATSVWLGAAAALETHAWRLNPDIQTGQPEPLYPAQDAKWSTKFRWEKE